MSKLSLAGFVAVLAAVAAAAPAFAGEQAGGAAVKAGTVTTATSGRLIAQAPPADFGNPPAGEIPILFNDHHVYAKPDVLRQGRVLAALVRNGVVLVPLRSMFEQMGATVSFDSASKSVTAKKEGATVQVTLGRSEVVINGESRPLDVPPMMYKGNLLVPVRVISEALGAYVQWVPSQRAVAIRYVPATPAPTPLPTIAPTPPPVPATPAPTPKPTPAPTIAPYLGFVQAGYTLGGKVYNEFSNGAKTKGGSYVASGAYLFDPFAIKVDFRQDEYDTTAAYSVPSSAGGPLPCATTASFAAGTPITCFATIDGGYIGAPQFRARQSTLDGRLEYKVVDPHIYIGGSYLQASTNYGYPQLRGVGFGLEKLPDFTSQFGVYGSVFYYPNANGTYTVPSGPNAGLSFKQEYRIVKYDVGATVSFGQSPVYLMGGFSGDQYTGKQFAPVNQTHSGAYVGLGVHF